MWYAILAGVAFVGLLFFSALLDRWLGRGHLGAKRSVESISAEHEVTGRNLSR